MAFILVPPTQPRVDVKVINPAESDRGPYPVPDNAPIEGWPLNGKALEDLQKVQLICGNDTCEEYRQLKAVIDGTASY